MFRNLNSYNYQGSFEGWAKRIFIHCAIDHFKKNYHHKSHASPETEEAAEIGDDQINVLAKLSAGEILELMKKLPPGYYMVLNLYTIEGFSHSEIAEMLNISESASRSQLSRARIYFKDILRKYQIEADEKRKP